MEKIDFTTILFWIIPFLLVIIFIIRLTRKNTPNSNSPNKERKLSTLQVILLTIFIVLTVVNIYDRFRKHNRNIESAEIQKGLSCNSKICPELFAEMINKDEDYIAGIFYDRGFERTEHEFKENNKTYTQYTYRLLGESQYGIQGDPFDFCYIRTDWDDWMFYVFKNREHYNEFLNYLKTLNVDTIDPEKYSHKGMLDKYSAYLFNDCVFIDRGFRSDNEGYTIQMFSYNWLKPKNNFKDSVDIIKRNQILTLLNQSRFKDKNNSDYIRFFHEKGNTFSFTGKVENKSLIGKAKLTSEELQIVSGNCEGTFRFTDNYSTLIASIIHVNESWRNEMSFELFKESN